MARTCRKANGDPKDRLTRNEAIARAARMREKYFKNIDAYKCNKCKCWHVGNDNRAVGRKK